MERFQKLQAVAGMGKFAEVEGVIMTPTVALKILEMIPVEDFFLLPLKVLCRRVNSNDYVAIND